MSQGAHIAKQIAAAFPGMTLYEIFELNSDADEDAIKKAYKRKALLHHPDKGGDAEKFKAMGCAHAVLCDATRRRVYDQTGEIDASEVGEEAAEWAKYFQKVFPKVTKESIEKFSASYKFSEAERKGIGCICQIYYWSTTCS